jgi:hypothetical protein
VQNDPFGLDNFSDEQEEVSTPFRGLYANGQLYIVKPSPAEREVLGKSHFIFHYSGHCVSSVGAEEGIPFNYYDENGNRPSVIIVHNEDVFAQDLGLSSAADFANYPALPNATQEAEWVNYKMNYKILDENKNFTGFVIIRSITYFREKVTNGDVLNQIIIDQADFLAPELDLSNNYYNALSVNDTALAESILNQAKEIYEDVSTAYFSTPNEDRTLFLSKNIVPTSTLNNLIDQRNATGFRQAVVVNGELGVLVW